MSDKEKIQEMQFLEQNLQNLMLQKQSFQMEVSENDSALEEIEKAGDEVFKIIGQLMVKADKKNLKEELTNRKKMLDLGMASIEKQEKTLSEKLEKLREEVLNSSKK